MSGRSEKGEPICLREVRLDPSAGVAGYVRAVLSTLGTDVRLSFG
jgi:hypothetical protein